MTKDFILEKLKGNLIVSCQALEGEPLYQEDYSVMPLMARAANVGELVRFERIVFVMLP